MTAEPPTNDDAGAARCGSAHAAAPHAPPAPPEPGDCCGGGCGVCVFDLHDQALERHQRALADWLAAQGS